MADRSCATCDGRHIPPLPMRKVHRPHSKQLVWSLTVGGDGAEPVHYNVLDGNVTDDQTGAERARDQAIEQARFALHQLGEKRHEQQDLLGRAGLDPTYGPRAVGGAGQRLRSVRRSGAHGNSASRPF